MLRRRPSPRRNRGDQPAPGAELLVFDRASIRALDERARTEYQIPGLVLMENAARAVADEVVERRQRLGLAGGVVIACGTGNNGGDGLGAARHLHNAGLAVTVVLAGDASRCSGDAGVHLAIVRKMDIPLVEAPTNPGGALLSAAVEQGPSLIVVDALLGTGLDRPVREDLAGAILAVNALAERRATVVSVDVPSGMDADTGRGLVEPGGQAVHADLTVTFVGLKAGFLSLEGQPFVGDVVVAGIGAPVELCRRLGRRLDLGDRPGEPGSRPARRTGKGGPGRSRRGTV